MSRRSEIMRRLWATPEYRARMLSSGKRFRDANPAAVTDKVTKMNRAVMGSSRSPNTQKATVKVTTRDLAWAAGFLEGEGSFRPTSNNGAEVKAVQVELEPLYRLLALFGGRIQPRNAGRNSPPTWKQSHVWIAYGARARGIAMTLYVMMSRRRQTQIRRLLGSN